MKRFGAQVLIWIGLSVLRVGGAITSSKDGYHVFPGDNIQDALQQAAESKTNKIVKVPVGTIAYQLRSADRELRIEKGESDIPNT